MKAKAAELAAAKADAANADLLAGAPPDPAEKDALRA